MRWADLTALIAAALWLGGNLAMALAPIVMFNQAMVVGLTRAEVGELFGEVMLAYMLLSCGFAGLFLLARLVGWTIRLRRARMQRWSLVGVLLLVGVLTTFGLGFAAVAEVRSIQHAIEVAEEDAPDEVAGLQQRFKGAHQRSTDLFKALSALLALTIGALAVSLARRDAPLPASAPPAAP